MNKKNDDYELIKEKDKFYVSLKEIIEKRNVGVKRELLENNDVRYVLTTKSQYVSCWFLNDIRDLLEFYKNSYWNERIVVYDYFVSYNYDTECLDIIIVVRWSL